MRLGCVRCSDLQQSVTSPPASTREVCICIGHWTFQGFNARYSNKSVVTTYYSNNLTLQKIVAWDAGNANDQVLLAWNSEPVLIEDFAGFGIANQICVDYTSTHVTLRRLWCRSEGDPNRM